MTCISPPELDDRQLLAYLDGEAGEQVAAHLAACAYCRERAEALEKLQNSLAARLYRLDCPEPEVLGDYQLRLLPAERYTSVAQHVQACPHCARELAQMRDYLRELPPPATTSFSEAVKVLVARLVGEGGETGRSPAMGTLRGAAEGPARQGPARQGPLTLVADGILIVLDIQPQAGGGFSLQGQVAAEDQERWTEARVELHQAGLLLGRTSIDDLGSFRFTSVPPGAAQLQLQPGDGPVVLARFEIRA